MTTAIQPDRSTAQRQVDFLQFYLARQPQLDCPLTHRFTPGLYARELKMPAGAAVISRVHKTRHPYVILTGRVKVWTEDQGVVELTAPHVGITEAGTRRVLIIEEECRWITFHPTTETDLDKLQEELTEAPDVSYMSEVFVKLRDESFAAQSRLLGREL